MVGGLRQPTGRGGRRISTAGRLRWTTDCDGRRVTAADGLHGRQIVMGDGLCGHQVAAGGALMRALRTFLKLKSNSTEESIAHPNAEMFHVKHFSAKLFSVTFHPSNKGCEKPKPSTRTHLHQRSTCHVTPTPTLHPPRHLTLTCHPQCHPTSAKDIRPTNDHHRLLISGTNQQRQPATLNQQRSNRNIQPAVARSLTSVQPLSPPHTHKTLQSPLIRHSECFT